MNLIVGDSHSNWITFDNSIHLLCSAGSAKGLNNQNSISQYNHTILDNVANNDYKHLFFLFGSVDVDFSSIHHYLKNPGLNWAEFNVNVIRNYLEFIVREFSDRSVIILSIGLPVLDDENLKKGLLNGHINYLENKKIEELENELLNACLPDIYGRTTLTLHFNEELKNQIHHIGNPNIKFLDITSFTYDNNLKRIKDEFFIRCDHHCFDRNYHYTGIINDFLRLQLSK
jgi:hypothetical protein